MSKDNAKKTEIKISGMGCAACAIKVEKALTNELGVISANVNLASEKATIEYDSNNTNFIQLSDAIENSGYDVIKNHIAFRIEKLQNSDISKIESIFLDMDGVTNTQINLENSTVEIEYNQFQKTIIDLRELLEDNKYVVLGIDGQDDYEIEDRIKQKELRSKLFRLIVGFGFSLPLFAIMLLGIKLPISNHYFMLLVTIIPFIYVSFPIFKAAFKSLKNKALDMDVMYSMGMGVAFISSLLGTFNIILTPDFMFYESALMLASFLTLGKFLEDRAKGKTSEAIRKLIDLQPKNAKILKNDEITEISIHEIKIKDKIIVESGETIPVDGKIIDGESHIDESMITGESIPKLKTKNDEAIAGTINISNKITLEVIRIGKDTVLAQIIKMVDEAQGIKPPIQRIADKVVSYFVPTVISLSILSFLAWYFLFNANLLFSLSILISILVVACPCALGLATPTAITVGVGRASELGILIKDGEALEKLEKINAILFDKTGTLTYGNPKVTNIITFNNASTQKVLSIAASLEMYSNHPLANAIVSKSKEEKVELQMVTDVETLPAKGMVGKINSKEAMVGNRALLRNNRMPMDDLIWDTLDELETNLKTTTLVAYDGEVIGVLGISDSLKENAKLTINELHKLNMDTIMVTGDNNKVANSVANELNIDKAIFEVTPTQKAFEVSNVQEKGKKVAFVGDGINDAPALAQSDVGIAIGNGTDIAIESGDIILLNNDPLDVIVAIELSKKVLRRIKENIFWAFAYNIILIPIAAGVLYPLFGITFRPEYAGLAMSLSSVTVVSLSLLLKKYTPEILLNKNIQD